MDHETKPADQPSVADWDWNAMEQLAPAERIDYITDRLAVDKKKIIDVTVAILALRNLADEMREKGS